MVKKQETKKDEKNKKAQKQDQKTKKSVGETDSSVKPKKVGLVKYAIILTIFSITAIFMYWTNKATVPENATMIMYITLSVLLNISIILVLIGTGIGIEVVNRFLNKFRYKSGNFVNTLHVMKSGVIKERFVKKDAQTGAFKMVEQPYVTSAKLMLNYKGIPTYFHKEGSPTPLDVWNEDGDGSLSNGELDIVMTSAQAFDVKSWLDKNKQVIFMGGVMVIGVCLITTFFGYLSYEMLRDGTFKQAEQVICSNIPKAVETISNIPIGGQ